MSLRETRKEAQKYSRGRKARSRMEDGCRERRRGWKNVEKEGGKKTIKEKSGGKYKWEKNKKGKTEERRM